MLPVVQDSVSGPAIGRRPLVFLRHTQAGASIGQIGRKVTHWSGQRRM